MCCLIHVLSKTFPWAATASRGLILNPSSNMNLDYCLDSDFAVMSGHQNITDLLVHWLYNHCGGLSSILAVKLQTDSAFSTMEVEIIEMAQSCEELFPVIDMASSFGGAVGLPKKFGYYAWINLWRQWWRIDLDRDFSASIHATK